MEIKKRMKLHKHYWSYEHAVYDGRKEDEVGVHRYCRPCGLHQIAYSGKWQRPTQPKWSLKQLKASVSFIPHLKELLNN